LTWSYRFKHGCLITGVQCLLTESLKGIGSLTLKSLSSCTSYW
jgi:hypothetical protein